MPDSMRQKWIMFFQEMFELESISFARCVKPINAKGKPMLIIFSDASTLAYGACAYIRWKLNNGCYESQLFSIVI